MLRKQAEETALICFFQVSLLSSMMPRFLACSVGVGPTSAGQQDSSYGDVLLPKISTSVLLVLNLIQFFCIQWAMLVIHKWKPAMVVPGLCHSVQL